VLNIKPRDRESRDRSKENIRREVCAGCDAGETDRCGYAIRNIRHPAMLPIPVRENRRDRKAHHRVTRWKAAALSQGPAIALEKRIGIFAVQGNIRWAQPTRDRLRNDHQDRIVNHGFPGKQTGSLSVRVLANQAHHVKRRRNRGDHPLPIPCFPVRGPNPERNPSVENTASSGDP